jgi:hypothetical protein
MITNNSNDFVDVIHRDGGEYRAELEDFPRKSAVLGQITARTALFARFYATPLLTRPC